MTASAGKIHKEPRQFDLPGKSEPRITVAEWAPAIRGFRSFVRSWRQMSQGTVKSYAKFVYRNKTEVIRLRCDLQRRFCPLLREHPPACLIYTAVPRRQMSACSGARWGAD